jgi:GNAT superfamily N-acetyltransferase
MRNNLLLTTIVFGSPQYDETVALRMDVLRKPLGISFEPGDLAAEDTDYHLCAFNNSGVLLACLVMTPKGNSNVKMRQFAVHENYQRQGIGSELVSFAEKWAADQGFQRIILHARLVAVPFYKKLDYKIEGEEFLEVTIPHYAMFKDL